ncbi:MAG: hypothetical protein EPN22_17305, partial [Nitrospirae bacterium]
DYDFSFSGLKTALALYLRAHPDALPADVAASLQESVVDVLAEKTLRAARAKEVKRVIVVGGVAANSRLRERLLDEGQRLGYAIFFPSMALCTDNAAMIAAVAHFKYQQGEQAALTLSPEPSLEIPNT